MEINKFLENVEVYNFLDETPESFEFIDDSAINSPFEFLQKMSEYLGNIKFEYSDKIKGGKKFNIESNVKSIKLNTGGEIKITDKNGKRIFTKTGDSKEEIINSKIKDVSVNYINIVISKDFSYGDFPKLFLELENKHNDFVKNTEKYKKYSKNDNLLNSDVFLLKYSNTNKKKYEDKIVTILKLFENNYFIENTSSEVKEIWKKRIKLYYSEYLQYFRKNDDGKKRINTLLKLPNKDKKIQNRILKNIKIAKSQASEGEFTKEAKELLELDLGENFSILDLKKYFLELKKYIDVLNISKKEKEQIKKIIKIRKKVDNEKNENYLSNVLFEVSAELDKKFISISDQAINNNISNSLKISEKEDINQLKEEINTLFEDAIIEQANSSAWRLSSLPTTIKEVFGKEKFKKELGEYYIETNFKTKENIEKYFKNNFEKQWKDVKDANEKLNKLRKKIKNDPKNLDIINELSKTEAGIAFIINEIIYSQKFISYGNNFSPKGIYGKGIKGRNVYEQNCYGQANIMNYILRTFFKLNVNIANRDYNTHFIPILELSNGILLRLDYSRENLSEKGIKNISEPQNFGNSSIVILPPEKNNKVGLYSHIVVNEKFPLELKKYFLKKSIKISPNRFSLYSSYINILCTEMIEKDNLDSLVQIKKIIEDCEKKSFRGKVIFYEFVIGSLLRVIKKGKDGVSNNIENIYKLIDSLLINYHKELSNIDDNSLNKKEKVLKKLKKRFELIKKLKIFSKNIDKGLFFNKRDEIYDIIKDNYSTFDILDGTKKKVILKNEILPSVGFNSEEIKKFLNKFDNIKFIEIMRLIFFKKYFKNETLENLLYLINPLNWNKYKHNSLEYNMDQYKQYFLNLKKINLDFTGKDLAIFNSYGLTLDNNKNIEIIKIINLNLKNKENEGLELNNYLEKISKKNSK